MNKANLIDQITAKMKGLDHFSTSDLTKALNDILPNIAPSTISWRIHQLKSNNIIHQVGRGLYSFDFKPKYIPELSLKTKRLYNRVKPLCSSTLSIWDTSLLNTIGDTNISRHWVFISTSKEELEPLFNQMLDFSKQTFLQPDKEVINRYLMAHKDAIILSPLISETPLLKSSDYVSPTIEGILVNAWLKNEEYLQPIGFDLKNIFMKALEKYNVNQSKLLRYAARRDKRNEIIEFIKTLV